MISIAYTALTVLLTLGAIAAHEAGHLFEMRAAGVNVEEFAIGFGPPVYSRKLASGLTFRIRALPLGGFVKAADAEQIKALDARRDHHISAAGVWTNVWLGCALLTAACLIDGFTDRWMVGYITVGLGAYLLRGIAAPWTVWIFGPLLVVGTVASIIITGSPGLGGPIAVAQTMSVHSLSAALGQAGAVSIGLALINSLPLLGLDGGRITRRWISDRFGAHALRHYDWFAGTAMLLLVVGLFSHDLIGLL